MSLVSLLLLGCPWISVPGETPDDTGAACTETVYADHDGDSFGDADAAGSGGTCPGDGWVTDNDDCDDDDPAVGEIVWYLDADDDTFGDPEGGISSCTNPGAGTYVEDATDCDDHRADVNPIATEICDDIDNDCDALIDDADASLDASTGQTFYADEDGDTYGDAGTWIQACEAPEGYVADSSDCLDTDPAYRPGADEYCDDPADYNCDGSTLFEDADGDGYAACLECDDSDGAISPVGTEVCDGADNNCDGATDEDSAANAPTWYFDADLDGFGNEDLTAVACAAPEGYVTGDDGFDCDDVNATVYPLAPEACDSVDHDCDGALNEDDATDATGWYADGDSDGYGTGAATQACTAPAGTVEFTGDCDDTDATFNPSASESCTEATDYNCDGSTGYADADGDGYAACEDCDDATASNNADGLEVCDGADNDCDGDVDEATADSLVWYADVDGDGFGDPSDFQIACSQPEGFVIDNGDCDDTEPLAWEGAPDVCDSVDNDCSGAADDDVGLWYVWYADIDGDGYGDDDAVTEACEAPPGALDVGGDCDDTSAEVRPDAAETCDGVDTNCTGDESDASDALTWYADADGDSYGDGSVAAMDCTQPELFVADSTDCDDTSAEASPVGTEVCGDGLDNDCVDGDLGCGPSGEMTVADAELVVYGDVDSYGTLGSTVVAGDVTGDGIDDIVAGGASTVWLVEGGTSGTVLASSLESFSASGACMSIGDVDGDGVADIAKGRDYSWDETNWSVYEGPLSSSSTPAFSGTAACPAMADLDGDGRDDLVWRGVADGASYETRAYEVRIDHSPIRGEDATLTQTATTAAYTVDGYAQGISVDADIDGDGLPDAAVLDDGAIYLLALGGGVRHRHPCLQRRQQRGRVRDGGPQLHRHRRRSERRRVRRHPHFGPVCQQRRDLQRHHLPCLRRLAALLRDLGRTRHHRGRGRLHFRGVRPGRRHRRRWVWRHPLQPDPGLARLRPRERDRLHVRRRRSLDRRERTQPPPRRRSVRGGSEFAGLHEQW